MSDQVYILISEFHDDEYSMTITGVFSSLESAVKGCLLAMTNSSTEEECLSSIVNLQHQYELNYENFYIKKATLDNMIDAHDKWRYGLIPVSRSSDRWNYDRRSCHGSSKAGSQGYDYDQHNKDFSAPEGFYLVRSKMLWSGPISCSAENKEKFMGGSCEKCNDHDVEFSFDSNFLDRFNEIWINRFVIGAYEEYITRSTQMESDYEIPPNAIRDSTSVHSNDKSTIIFKDD
ncbi:Hypothetical protein HVR_LOCUS1319 [uncultured virus]|nr:Hypothetical protein HVR_LOCUS1319 [uncultured virus]